MRTYEKELISNKVSDSDRIHDGILASMAVSPAYPPVWMRDKYGHESLFADGGYTEGVPVESCLELADNSLTTFIVLCDSSGSSLPVNNDLPTDFMSMFLGTASLSIDLL